LAVDVAIAIATDIQGFSVVTLLVGLLLPVAAAFTPNATDVAAAVATGVATVVAFFITLGDAITADLLVAVAAATGFAVAIFTPFGLRVSVATARRGRTVGVTTAVAAVIGAVVAGFGAI
jgi:hypothetical protein